MSANEVEHFREADGRRYQATDGVYALPADAEEYARLDAQHYAYKATQHDKLYIAPVPQAVPGLGEGKRILDEGCGTGIWTIEIAGEFPEAEVVGVDLAPTHRTREEVEKTGIIYPKNVSFVVGDITKRLPFADQHFDVIHVRSLLFGVKDWRALISEVVRLLRPGGLFISIEGQIPYHCIDVPDDQQSTVAPGLHAWVAQLAEAFDAREMDKDVAANTMKMHLDETGAFGEVTRVLNILPFWGWSEEPHMKKAGEIYEPALRDAPETARAFIQDGCGMSREKYDVLKQGFLKDLGRPGVTSAFPIFHNWAFRK